MTAPRGLLQGEMSMILSAFTFHRSHPMPCHAFRHSPAAHIHEASCDIHGSGVAGAQGREKHHDLYPCWSERCSLRDPSPTVLSNVHSRNEPAPMSSEPAPMLSERHPERNERFTGRNQGFTGRNERSTERMKASLDGVKASLDGVKASLEGVKASLDGVKPSLDGVKDLLVGVKRHLTDEESVC